MDKTNRDFVKGIAFCMFGEERGRAVVIGSWQRMMMIVASCQHEDVKFNGDCNHFVDFLVL